MIQRGAEAVYSPEGRLEVERNIDYYLRNATLLCAELNQIGMKAIGGANSPYIWVKSPNGMSSWEMFDMLLIKPLSARSPAPDSVQGVNIACDSQVSIPMKTHCGLWKG